MIKKQQIHYWNGNKTATRRSYEKELLQLCLLEAGMSDAKIVIDETDYPDAEDEGNIFASDCDVLVSVAGNQKFDGKATHVIEIPICRGILGHRLLIVRQPDAGRFAKLHKLEQLQTLTIGIPATWADADLFRKNDCSVFEKGSLDNIFDCLLKQECDYIALGANEIESIFEQYSLADLGLAIAPNIFIYYPLPLVFYVHPERFELLKTIEMGLNIAIENGKHALLFEQHHPHLRVRLGLAKRTRILLKNPYLPISLANFCPQQN